MHTLGQGGIYSLNDLNNDQCSPNKLKVIGKGTISVKTRFSRNSRWSYN